MKTKTLFKALSSALALLVTSLSSGNDFPVSFSGFISQGYIETSNYNYLVASEDGTTDFAEAGLKATWSPIERTVISGQVFAFELGQYGNYEPQLDYLFVDYNINQMLGFRGGRVKKSVGLYNDIQDIDVARTSILLPIGMYDQRYRDFSASIDGISLYGSLDAKKWGYFDYNLFGGTANLSPEGGLGGFVITALSRSFVDPTIDLITDTDNVGGQLWWNTPLSGLRLGWSSQLYKDLKLISSASFPAFYPVPFLAGQEFVSTSVIDIDATSFSAEYYVGNWTLNGEYSTSVNSTVRGQQVGVFPESFEEQYSRGESWFVGASRRFLEKFEAGVTYTEYYADALDHHGTALAIPHTGYNRDTQFSIRWDAKSFWTLKAEIHDIEGTNRLFNQSGQNPVLDQENWTLFAAKSTFTF